MRRSIATLAAALLVLAAPAALAAPTCQDRDGLAIRCGTPGAMPVGWSLPPQDRQGSEASDQSSARILGLLAVLGGLFALFALLPPFDGWDKSEGGEENEGR